MTWNKAGKVHKTLYNMEDLCRYLNISENTVRNWLKKWCPNLALLKLSVGEPCKTDPILLTKKQFVEFMDFYHANPKKRYSTQTNFGLSAKHFWSYAWQRFSLALQPYTVQFLKQYGTDWLDLLAALPVGKRDVILDNIMSQALDEFDDRKRIGETLQNAKLRDPIKERKRKA